MNYRNLNELYQIMGNNFASNPSQTLDQYLATVSPTSNAALVINFLKDKGLNGSVRIKSLIYSNQYENLIADAIRLVNSVITTERFNAISDDYSDYIEPKLSTGGGVIDVGSGAGSSVRINANNTASGIYSTALGVCNSATLDASIVLGGGCNTASGCASTVINGGCNTASGVLSTVSNGYKNTASGTFSTVLNGGGIDGLGNPRPNIASGSFSTILNGALNSIISGNGVIATFKIENYTGTLPDGTFSNLSANSQTGTGTGAIFNIGIKSNKPQATLINSGENYNVNDTLTFNGSIFGGSSPADDIVIRIDSISNFTSNHSTISNGCNNTISGYSFLTISNGYGNTASNNWSTVSNGYRNTASGNYSTVSNGYNNIASGCQYSTVLNGCNNRASVGANSTVINGQGNTASGNYSTVINGNSNCASGCNATVSNGCLNNASNSHSTVSNGVRNNASGQCSTVSNGYCNNASGCHSTVSNGRINSAISCYTTVSNGLSNTASSFYATVLNGNSNNTSGIHSTVINGDGNNASSNRSTVLNGTQNTASGYFSTVSNGCTNTASGTFSTVSNGYCNTASGCRSFIAGGQFNNTCTLTDTFILGSCICADRVCTTFVNNLSIINIPTSSSGLTSGSVWRNGTVLEIVP